MTKLLIIDDETKLRETIAELFSFTGYNVIEAQDGMEGLEKVKQHNPSLIICDLMMPKLDGNRLIDKVKSDDQTAHIPIVILSAKDQLKSKIELYEKGVENYLTKPFDIVELKAVVDSVLSQRRKLMDIFFSNIGTETIHNIPQPVENPKFPKIVQDTMDYVLENMENSNLNVSIICDELNIGRNRLQREIKDVVGLTPVEFIRSLRLNEAKKRLSDYKQTVSEVAYAVGFNNLSYFSRSFKTEFGMLPSEWQEEQVRG